HIYGDTDHLGWDLGDPAGAYAPPPPGQPDTLLAGFHPMKGPMMTQTLRGTAGTGPLHWRGDRTNLRSFNAAFVSLMGLTAQLPDHFRSPRFSFVNGDDDRADLVAYLRAFDTGIAPAVGYQLTFDGANNLDPGANATLDTLVGQADAGNCDLIAKGRIGDREY